jgi:ZIP family zinc transporter
MTGSSFTYKRLQGQHSNVGTVFFAVGFSVMMVLDVALG